MKSFILHFILALASILVVLFAYLILVWGLEAGSSYFGANSTIGRVTEPSLFWLSHFGFAPIMLPVLMIIVYYVLKKYVLRKIKVSHEEL